MVHFRRELPFAYLFVIVGCLILKYTQIASSIRFLLVDLVAFQAPATTLTILVKCGSMVAGFAC